MTRYLAGSVLLAALFSGPQTSSADPVFSNVPAVYDTVDAVEVFSNRITVTGIVSGQSTVSELVYLIQDSSTTNPGVNAMRCDRLALLAIAKPGKYQFAVTRTVFTGANLACKLIVRAP